jgi:Ras-related protein Rab-2A
VRFLVSIATAFIPAFTAFWGPVECSPIPVRPAGWDTAGTESFRSITRSYYRGAAGCLLVYDVTSRPSASFYCCFLSAFPFSRRRHRLPGFEHARTWLADVRAHADPHLTCILVGNKNDLASERRQVQTEEGQQWAQDEGLLFVEASAKSGINVEAAFEAAVRDILAKIRRGVFDDDRVRLVHLRRFTYADNVIAPVPWC